MVALWRAEAERNQVFPLDHSFRGRGTRSAVLPENYRFWGKDISMPATRVSNIGARSFTVDADLALAHGQASGVILALGSYFAGWSLFLEKGKPAFVYARTQEEEQVTKIVSSASLPAGKTKLRLTFELAGAGKPAKVALSSDGKTLATGKLPATFSLPGGHMEMLDTGRDTGVPVTGYTTQHGEFEGEIRLVELNLK
jgi:arylsulfatase